MKVLYGVLIPFFGTFLGSSIVLFLNKYIKESIEKLLMGFAAGVMIAASVWSLLIPAIDISTEQGKIVWFAPSIGFILGVLSLFYIDRILNKLHIYNEKIGEFNFRKKAMLIIAVTLHNIPEGMAVGVAFAGAIMNNINISIAGALALAIGIAIQNIPEGAIVSMPLLAEGVSRKKAFLYGVMSGIVEPIGAVITIYLTKIVVPILPYLLSFAAGAMMYVVTDELIPESKSNNGSMYGILGITFGFVIMMILDISLG